MSFASARRPILAAAILAALSAALTFSAIGRVELTFDEAYYALWSRHLAWGYYDHPPAVALWIRASTTLFGDSEFGVRALGAALFALYPVLIGTIATRLYDSARIGAFAALCWLAMPLGAGAALATPDAPLTFFSGLALAGLIEVFRGRAWGWAAIGLGLGLALEAKFTALFLGAGVALALVLVPSMRKWLRSPAPYLAAIGASALFAPFVLWNAWHGWATFKKQFGRVPGHAFSPFYLAEFLAGQLALANPLLLIATTSSLGKTAPETMERRRLLAAFVAPAILYFLFHGLHDRVQGNWTAPLYPALAILAGEAAARGPIWARRTAFAGITLGFAAILLIYIHVVFAWPSLGPADPMARIGGWREIAEKVEAEAKAEGVAYILPRGYAATSLITYYGDGSLPVVQSGDRARWIFAAAPDPSLFAQKGLAVAEAGRGEEADLKSKFRNVERLGELPRRQSGAVVETYELFRVSDLISDPAAWP